MLTEKQIQQIRDELDSCKNPLIFFHDDPDGLSCYLLLYRYMREGHGIAVKSTPRVDDKFLNKVVEYDPDKIFITDLAMVDESFVEKAKRPIVWIDHHDPIEMKKVKYFNPRVNDPKVNIPASQLCYEVVKQDLWIAAIGIVGDWVYSKYHAQFSKEYPDLLPAGMDEPGKILFETKIGELARIMGFCLKGKTGVVNKLIKAWTKLEGPYEILHQESDAGKLIWDHYMKINDEYQKMVQKALKSENDSRLFVFTYPDDKMSFSGGLSNELLYKMKDKVIILGRIKEGTVRCSMRSPKDISMKDIMREAMHGVEGYGGGHEHACGGTIKVDDFPQFVENVKDVMRNKGLYPKND